MNYVVDSYENYKEENRLTTNNARRIEFVTTTRVLDEIIHDNMSCEPVTIEIEYYGAVTPQIRQAGNRLSGLPKTNYYASLLA